MPVGPNSPYTYLDQTQILQRSFDENEDRLRVDAQVSVTLGTVACEISAATGDNIAITNQDGTNPLIINGDGSINAVVGATDFDIRNLTFATDKVDVTGSSVTVSSTDLDIRNLTFATDKVDVTGSSVTVSATDLDIRNLSHTQDSVKIGDGTDFLSVNTDGSINVIVEQNQTPISVTFDATQNTDVLRTPLSAKRYNQLEVNFETAPSSAYITNTTTGTGSITVTNGHTGYASGTGNPSSAKGVSVQTVSYRPGNEIYSYFTAAFTTPTSNNSFQRIGLYDDNNGFFIGYEGTTFGVVKRTSGTDTKIPRTSFNSDLLDGSATSKFTRNGIPEAINLTYSNLFRIRFAWLGSGNIFFEVFSPDGQWVLFHNIRQPNSDVNPSIYNPNLPMTIHVSKTVAGGISLVMYTACWAAGTTSEFTKITDPLTDYTLASLNRSVITGRSSTGGGTYYNVKVNPSGSLLTAIGDISDVDGQATMATSFPVVIASDQSTIPVKLTTSTLTYSASALFSYAANGTDIFTISGSATKTIKIKQIMIDGIQTTLASRDITFIKRSSANSGGSSTAVTAVPFDSASAAATASVRYYTVNPGLLGTSVGIMHSERLVLPSVTDNSFDSIIFSTIDATAAQDITLRGVNEFLCINMGGVTSAGNSMNINIIWTEE